jgi:phosphonoacetaldehyde hydrolase
VEKIRLVILEWAGTIVDFGALAPVDAWVRLFARHGVEIGAAEVRAASGPSAREQLQAIVAAVEERWADAHGGRGPTPAEIDKLALEYGPLELEAVITHATAIPGAAAAVSALRNRGLQVGGAAGHRTGVSAALEDRARAQGLVLDGAVSGFEPMHTVRISGGVTGVAEARKAGVWSVGVAATGSEVGLDEASFSALSPEEQRRRVLVACDRLLDAGAHTVMESIADAPALVDALDARLARGERP